MVFRSFRLHCRRPSFLFVSRLGCATAFCPSTAAFSCLRGFRRQRFGLFCTCGFVAFWAVLGSDLGGVWLFRIHCRRALFLSV